MKPDQPYLPGLNIRQYLKFMASHWPNFYNTLWLDRPQALLMLNKIGQRSNEFETEQNGGRGDTYRKAQKNTSVRAVGINHLLKLIIPTHPKSEHLNSFKILDVLGGDGVLARTLNLKQQILTSDISSSMIKQALTYGLPAVRQPAQYLLVKDNSFNAVIIAYGTHHILPSDRLSVCKEAFRVLKLRGKIVIHDFEKTSAVARWFKYVVDRYSITGHKYRHFTANELKQYLKQSGFRNIQTSFMYDPFIIRGKTEREVYNRLMDYVLNMYGLKLTRNGMANLIKDYLVYDYENVKAARPDWKKSLSFSKHGHQWIGEIPRVALVATGVK